MGQSWVDLRGKAGGTLSATRERSARGFLSQSLERNGFQKESFSLCLQRYVFCVFETASVSAIRFIPFDFYIRSSGKSIRCCAVRDATGSHPRYSVAEGEISPEPGEQGALERFGHLLPERKGS